MAEQMGLFPIAKGTPLEGTPGDDDLRFMPGALTQVYLPRRRPEPHLREIRHECFDYSLILRAGDAYDGKTMQSIPLPFGRWPRLLLLYLHSQALQTGLPEVALGDSARECLRLVAESDCRGGERGSYNLLREQALALASCMMTVGFINPETGNPTTVNTFIVSSFESWWTNRGRALWPGRMVLAPEYFELLKRTAVPLDWRAISNLRGCLDLDLYAFLAQRLRRLRRPTILPWSSIVDQFAPDRRADLKSFKREFIAALESVLRVYPGAKVERLDPGPGPRGIGGFKLHPSDPPVLAKSIRHQNLRHEVAAREAESRAEERRQMISRAKTIDSGA